MSTSTISTLDEKFTESVVANIPFDFENINNIITPNTISIKELDNIEYKNVVTGVNLYAYRKKVVEKIYTKQLDIVSPSEQFINGSILCIGEGIMIVYENMGDICIYSLCKLNSFTRT